jgi:hypothetical protein
MLKRQSLIELSRLFEKEFTILKHCNNKEKKNKQKKGIDPLSNRSKSIRILEMILNNARAYSKRQSNGSKFRSKINQKTL